MVGPTETSRGYLWGRTQGEWPHGPHRSVSSRPGPGLQESTGLTAGAMANDSPERVFTGQPRTGLHYEAGGRRFEGSYRSPLLDTGRQELA